MPWDVRKQDDQFCVFKKGTQDKVACHATRDKAVAQMRALYANEGKNFSEQDLLIEVKGFSDLVAEAGTGEPVWIQAFPYGHWPHPIYTDTTITGDRGQRLVKNFKDNVRRQDIATDYNHGQDPAKGSKASGWVRDAELRDDGVYIAVDFTPTARQEIAAGEWKYFSAMMLDAWEDAELGEVYEDVLIGGGLTNAPYMKGRVPLNFAEVLPISTPPVGVSGGQGDSGKRYKLSIEGEAVNYTISEDGGITWREATKAEVTEWEHSEPGTGSPPIPRTDEDDKSGDKDGKGIRRDTPPIELENLNKQKGGVEVKLSAAMLTRLGLTEESTDADVELALTKVYNENSALVTEITPLRELAKKTETEKTFAEQFPEQAAELDQARKDRVSNQSKTFSEQFERIVKVDGEGDTLTRTPTGKGPSGLALQKMRDAHTAIVSGAAADEVTKAFSEFVETILTDKGIVDYSEKGSGRVDNTTADVPSDRLEAAKKFSELCTVAQTEAGGQDKLSWGDAVAKISKEQPALFAASRGVSTPSA